MTDIPGDRGLIACHECDCLHHSVELPAGSKALCRRCGSLLYQHIPNSLDRSLALYLAALLALIIANMFPFMSLKLGGLVQENILLSGVWALHEYGMTELSVLILVTSVVFPAIVMTGMLYLLIAAKLDMDPPAKGAVYRFVMALTPWSLVGVFVLGVLIAIVKLQDLATVVPGISLIALFAWLMLSSAARANFDPSVLWPHTRMPEVRLDPKTDTAHAHGLTSCHVCHGLVQTQDVRITGECPHCHSPVHTRKHDSINRTWALLLTAAIMLIPANIFPIMTVIRFGQGEPDTIFSGVISLIESGYPGLALIVFFASIFVPVLKIIVLSFLLVTVQSQSVWRLRDRTLLYRVTEIVGAWSMVDIFLVGLLTALVSLGSLSTILPGPGASFFAAAVILTMLAAHTFDSRLIWDRAGSRQQ